VLLHWQLQERATVTPVAPVSVPLAGETASALQTVAQAASTLAGQDTPGLTMRGVVTQATAAIPGCDAAGVTVLRGKRRLETPESTGPDAAACDQLQYEFGQGPCLDAFDTNTAVRVDDLAEDERWPRFAEKATELGIRSVLSVPLMTPKGILGALNLYAHKPSAFDGDAEVIATVFATHAAIALFHAELEANLRMGLSTREEIGRAVGILMERHRVNAARAFDMLVYASQHSHRKLRYIALWVNETGEDPDSLVKN
jgi:GAF domain-containing protein